MTSQLIMEFQLDLFCRYKNADLLYFWSFARQSTFEFLDLSNPYEVEGSNVMNLVHPEVVLPTTVAEISTDKPAPRRQGCAALFCSTDV